ncbi:MAG TPA: hypothetical protein VLI46_15725 [Ramlibacter sp.]|nr:hypothetical protein [Ramlibacter sp.]
MEAAKKIRSAVAEVSQLRQAALGDPPLRSAVARIKRVQAQRFAGTYSDLLAQGPYADAARFFLEELYSDKDYGERDAQFARIAGAVEKLFPAQVAETAVSLAELHVLTEELDHAMGVAWLLQASVDDDARAYTSAWRAVGRRDDRERQLSVVLRIGHEMARLTRTPGLRMMLKMMRGPAAAAGLASLQQFLEIGFDTFAAMAQSAGAEYFLGTVRAREESLIRMLFDADLGTCETELGRTLGPAP